MFHVIIDSAIDLPEGSTFDDFSLVPLYVKIDTQYYKDVVDISRDEFFRILPNEYDRISTSQPNMEDFLAAINSSKHEDVLVMTISFQNKRNVQLSPISCSRKRQEECRSIGYMESIHGGRRSSSDGLEYEKSRSTP